MQRISSSNLKMELFLIVIMEAHFVHSLVVDSIVPQCVFLKSLLVSVCFFFKLNKTSVRMFIHSNSLAYPYSLSL
jgi:uncharacterized membrane protein